MLLNHISFVFNLPFSLEFIFSTFGYCTLPIMSYFLTEGYRHTHSRKKYFLRLVVFAIISQGPYIWALNHENGKTCLLPLNIFFTLALCFLIIDICNIKIHVLLKIVLVSILFLISKIMDWAYFAPLYTLLFFFASNDMGILRTLFLSMAVLMGLYQGIGALQYASPMMSFLYGCSFFLGTMLADFFIVYSYNGQGGKCTPLSKWFFYIFYPVHLLILGSIKFLISI